MRPVICAMAQGHEYIEGMQDIDAEICPPGPSESQAPGSGKSEMVVVRTIVYRASLVVRP